MKKPRAIIFDMDGTLTRPAIDFDLIRAEIGIESGTILEALEDMQASQRSRALKIIERHERIAALESELQDGALEVVDQFRLMGIQLAIATRNSRASVRTVIAKHGLEFDFIRTREDGAIKPSPEPVRHICEHFEVPVDESWVVGDYHYDILSGRNAGATTILMIGQSEWPNYANEADHVIRELRELLALVSNGECT